MTLRGLPDFQDPLVLPDGPVWPAFETQHWLAPAGGVRLAESADGVPAFRLSLTRPIAPFLPPPPYAVLDATLLAGRDTGPALAALRETRPRAALAPVHAAAGSARLEPAPGPPALPGELAEPVELIWNGLGVARFNLGFASGVAACSPR